MDEHEFRRYLRDVAHEGPLPGTVAVDVGRGIRRAQRRRQGWAVAAVAAAVVAVAVIIAGPWRSDPPLIPPVDQPSVTAPPSKAGGPTVSASNPGPIPSMPATTGTSGTAGTGPVTSGTVGRTGTG